MPIAVDNPASKTDPNGIKKLVVNPVTGMVTVETTLEQFEKAQKAMPFYDRAMTGLQTELDRLGQDEQRARSRHPVIGVIQEVAAALSQQHDMPGFVKGLGQASMALNPRADDIARQKLPLYMQLAKMEQDQAQVGATDEMRRYQLETARDNAVTNRSYREQMAAAATTNADTRIQQALIDQSQRMPLSEAQVRSRLGADADPAVVQGWVMRSKDIWDAAQQERQLKGEELKSRKLTNQATAASLAEKADLMKSQAEYNRARAKLVPLLGAARVGELDARRDMHLASGAKSYADIARDTNQFLLNKQKFDQAKSDQDIKNYGNLIMANPMAPQAEKDKAEALMKARKIIPDFVPVQPQAGPTIGPGPIAKPTYAYGPDGKPTHQLSPDGKSWMPLK